MNKELAERIQRGTFLVVDDFDTMRKVTANHLRQQGVSRIVEAANGAEALRILQRQPITLVLSDWNMPVMDGLELLQQVRATPRLAELPFLMITAEAERERVIAAIQAGVSEILVKPYTASLLSDRVAKALSGKPRPLPRDSIASLTPAVPAVAASAAAGERAGIQPSGGEQRATVLVVDDAADNLQLLSELLQGHYRVKVANNGPKALAICQSDAPPDLVLLDVMMPGIDGFEVARQLRCHPSSEHIPVIFVTAMSDQASRLRGMELGAVDFVTKPIDPATLVLRVRNFMRYMQLHRQLQADYDEMLRNARLRDDVEQITRHDLKGPLAGVIGLLQGLLADDSLSAAQRESLRLGEETALQVLDMVNLSAELYKIENGRYVAKPAPVALVGMLRRIAELQRKAFAIKQLQVTVVVPSRAHDGELQALGEATFCHSLFQNLIKNACEAAPEDSNVIITVYPAEAGGPLRVSIDNKGAVPLEMRERFFGKYATAGKPAGTGLGTYSARLLAEAQGGSVTMETSDERNSTRLVVLLPAQLQ